MNPFIRYMILHSGRSWWQARYSNVTVLSEWDTLTGRLLLPRAEDGGTSRWEDISKENMVGLRLLCPNGMVGELEAPEGHKFFQLKTGHFDVGIGKSCDAHIIGVVTNSEGDCLCRAWETKGARLIEFQDNVFHFRFKNIGLLSLDVQGLRL